jgi:exoribonuclease-2
VHSLPELAAGTRVRLQVKRVDTVMMELDTRFVAQLEETAAAVEEASEAAEG